MAGVLAEEGREERRRFARMPLTGIVQYLCAPNQGGAATWYDVCHGGVCIRLYRYLRPGRYVLLSVRPDTNHGAYPELKGRIVWCRRALDGGSFLAGLRVYCDTLDAESTLSELIQQARVQVGQAEHSSAQEAMKGLNLSQSSGIL